MIIRFNGDGTVTFNIYYNNGSTNPLTITSTGTSIYLSYCILNKILINNSLSERINLKC